MEDLDTIVIGFSKPRSKTSILSALIRLFEGTKFSHAYLRKKSKELDVEYVYQASGLTVNFMGVDNFLHKSTPVVEFEIDICNKIKNKVIAKAMRLAGRPYGMKQIFGIAWTMILERFGIHKTNPFVDGDYSYICSELIAELLHDMGIVSKCEWGKDLDSVTPKDLHDMLILKGIKQL